MVNPPLLTPPPSPPFFTWCIFSYNYLEPLTFALTIALTPTAIEMSGAMIGTWNAAFGVDMLALGDLQLAVGITAALGVPSFEMGASVYLGTSCFEQDPATKRWTKKYPIEGCVSAKAYFGFHPTDPSQIYAFAAFSGLTVGNIIETFAPDSVKSWARDSLPQSIKDSGFPSEMKDGTVGENPTFSYSGSPFGTVTKTGLAIPGGVSMKGELNILGYTIQGHFILNPSSRVKARLEMDPISFANGLFQVTRSSVNQDLGPLFDLDVQFGLLSPIPKFNFTMAGYINFFDIIEAECQIEIDTKGFRIYLMGSLFKLFTAELWMQASYASPDKAQFTVRGVFTNDLFEKIRKQVRESSGVTHIRVKLVADEQKT